MPRWGRCFVRRPLATRLDRNLVRILDFAQDLLNVLINGQPVEGDGLAADWTGPCRCLFLQHEERLGVETLVVGTYHRTTRSLNPQRRDGILQ
jgi:hypothetical protein